MTVMFNLRCFIRVSLTSGSYFLFGIVPKGLDGMSLIVTSNRQTIDRGPAVLIMDKYY